MHKVCAICKSENHTVKLTLIGTSKETGPIFRYLCSKCASKEAGWAIKP